MSRFGSRGPILTRKPKATGSRSKANVDVDPVMAAIVGLVIVGGGGLAAYGASQDTEPDPAPAPVVQSNDPTVERALRIVERADGSAADTDATSAAAIAREQKRAAAASRKGASVDPFAAIKSGTDAVTGVTSSATPGSGTTASSSSSSGSGSLTPKQLAERAAAQSAAANAAAGGTTTGSTTPTGSTGTSTTTTKPSTSTPAKPSRAAVLAAVANKPARISLRLKTTNGRSSVSKRSVGLLVPSTKTVARVIGISKSNKVVTLRLREGAYLTGKQSKGTMCVKRLSSGDCQLIRVRTGRTAIIRAPESSAGELGPVTALRVTAIWRGGYKVAG